MKFMHFLFYSICQGFRKKCETLIINRLILDDAHLMNEQEMKGTRGGVDVNHYCCVAVCLCDHNLDSWDDDEMDGAIYGLNLCKEKGFKNSENCQFEPDTCDYIGYID
jgi:hypothetical protein